MTTLFTNRHSGFSVAPFDSFNLGLHVGDNFEMVMQNRELLQKQTAALQFMNQVHGDSIVEIREVISQPTADALITQVPGIALAVLVADCIPLLLSSRTVIAAVHVGRKGLFNKIALKTISRMQDLGAENIHAQLGPSICGRCYEVNAEIVEEAKGDYQESILETKSGKASLDLPRALIKDLVHAGITYEASQICTKENLNYFSYRRRNVTGRTAGVIWL